MMRSFEMCGAGGVSGRAVCLFRITRTNFGTPRDQLARVGHRGLARQWFGYVRLSRVVERGKHRAPGRCVVLRLALTVAILHNWHTATPGRHLTTYDH